MKKGLLSTALLLSGLAAFAQKTDPAPYCLPQMRWEYNMIKQITIDTKVTSIGAKGTMGDKSGAYKYFNTTVLPTLKIGTASKFTIDFYSPDDLEPMYFAVWIDLNQNNTFEASEIMMQNSNTTKASLPTTGAAPAAVSLNITIPATAKTGKTRMRLIRGTNDADPYKYSNTFVLDSCPKTEEFGGDNAYGCSYDFDITIAKSGTSIAETSAKYDISLSPVPAQSVLNINNNSNIKMESVRITNLSGQTVVSQTLSNNTVDVSALATGLYIVHIALENGESFVSKIVKQ